MCVCTSATLAQKSSRIAENDSVVLLQAQAELQSQRAESVAALDSDDNVKEEEYGLESFKCDSEKKAEIKAAADNAEQAKDAVSAPQEPEQTEADPPGTDLVRLALQLMTIGLVFDGLRKWHLHSQEVESTTGKAGKAQDQAEAKAKAAWTKMVKAAKSGDERSFQLALAQHPVIMEADAWGCSPLHFAAAGGSSMIISELLKLGADIDALDAVDETPLHIAARNGSAPICELLVKAGANIDAVNKQGMTPLVVSGHANQEPACRFLADNGAGVADLTDEELPPLVVSQVVRKVLTQ